MRVCVAGGGLAGSLLAWRLAQLPGIRVDLMTGAGPGSEPGPQLGPGADATAASGGAVRAYEALPEQRELAIASLAELLASPVLREWAGYRETGFCYLRDTGMDLTREVAEIDRVLPGSAELISPAEAFGGADGPGWTGAGAAGTGAGGTGAGGTGAGVVVRERLAGYISPDGLRQAVIADLARRPHVEVRAAAVEASLAGFAGGYDAVVLAAGAWTPGLLRAIGGPAEEYADGYRTRSIQYTVYDAGPVCPPAFADERTGLYGRPTADGGLLLGVPTTEWDVPPGAGPVSPRWHDQALRLAAACFPRLKLGHARQQVSAADCYCDPPVLALRQVSGEAERLFTFTGGSGGSVKSVLAASRRAASQLQERPGHVR
jgi:glycine/D-amino acid oxidase-like deaminating enzyme